MSLITVLLAAEPWFGGAGPPDAAPAPASRAGTLFDDVRHGTGADRSAALADSEPGALFKRDRGHQLAADRCVVARHDHLDAFRQVQRAGDIGRPKIKLRAIAV